MRKIVIGVMGPGEQAADIDKDNAYQLGKLIAQQGWIVLSGGRNVGVMEAANQGAKAANGLTVGILPGNDTTNISSAVDIAIITDLGNARNNINVLSSDVVIACGLGIGTTSEIALALKNGKKVILLTNDEKAIAFFTNLSSENIFPAFSPSMAIELVKNILSKNT